MNQQIEAIMNEPSFEYDVRSLLRAFFPHAEVFFRSALNADKRRDTDRFYALFSAGSMLISWNESKWRGVSTYGFDRAAVKNELKRTLYDLLSAELSQSLPWGTLTGIRPVKLALKQVNGGASRRQVRDYLYETYRVSEKKADLAYAIAQREKRVIESFPLEDGYCLYVGIPFCPSICLYCSFSSYPMEAYRDRVDAYMKALFVEIEETARMCEGRPLSAVYVGGGTPTSLAAGQLSALMEKIASSFDLSRLREWTVEAGRPDSITEDKLLTLKELPGIRISINPQTFRQQTLDTIGRRHTVEETKEAFRMARGLGFADLKMDLIVGLPGEGEAEVAVTLKEVAALGPDNLTVHSLALKRASRLREEWERFGEDSFHQSDRIMEMVHRTAEEMAMEPYYLYRQKDIAGNLENVGFAKKGREGIYNILIMEEVADIVACGAGAISKRVGWINWPVRGESGRSDEAEIVQRSRRPEKTTRAANVKDVDQYIDRVEEMIRRKRELFS